MMEIIAFNLSKDKSYALKRISQKMNIHIRNVSAVDYEQKLGYLAGITGFKKEVKAKTAGLAVPGIGEMMVFSGMGSEQMDAFLNAWKESGAEPVKLKAVLTPTNVFWTPRQLWAELVQEHNRMNNR